MASRQELTKFSLELFNVRSPSRSLAEQARPKLTYDRKQCVPMTLILTWLEVAAYPAVEEAPRRREGFLQCRVVLVRHRPQQRLDLSGVDLYPPLVSTISR